MFANLIESDSHRKELKRRSSFFLATVAAYALVLVAAGIVSIYAYDAQLEAQTSNLELLSWVPPIIRDPARPIPENAAPRIHRSTPPNAPVDPNITLSERRTAVASTNDPTRVPEHPGTTPSQDPPVAGPFRLTGRNADPPAVPTNSGRCITCNDTQPARVEVNTPPPAPTPSKPQTQRLAPQILISKAISLPQPPYPPLARQIHLQGSVPVQILVDESGRVISARAVSGHAFLTHAAEEAAMRARFTPTTYNGQPVKVLGVITYNFVLQ